MSNGVPAAAAPEPTGAEPRLRWQTVAGLDAPRFLKRSSYMFEREFFVGWGDVDFNSHMRNTAYLDKSADIRMMFFSESGFAMDGFIRNGIGPVVMKDEVEYHKEIRLLERFRTTLEIAGLSQDGSRFVMRNEFYRVDGKLSARVTSIGGWLDLSSRKLTAPPDALHLALLSLPKTGDFHELVSSIKR